MVGMTVFSVMIVHDKGYEVPVAYFNCITRQWNKVIGNPRPTGWQKHRNARNVKHANKRIQEHY